MSAPTVYGIALEFDAPAALVEAARAVRDKGFRNVEAYIPYPIEELDEILPGPNPVPLMVLIGGILGALTALAMEYYIAVLDYPINVGGRPLNSWPAFIPITFELTILLASIAAFCGPLWLAGLPQVHHPVFNLSEFGRVTDDRFFLIVEAKDPLFKDDNIRESLWQLKALRIKEVEGE